MNKNNEKIKKIKQDLIDVLNTDNVSYDLSDIGNIIGIAIGEHISNDLGFEKDSFIHGIKHGISLIDKTHG